MDAYDASMRAALGIWERPPGAPNLLVHMGRTVMRGPGKLSLSADGMLARAVRFAHDAEPHAHTAAILLLAFGEFACRTPPSIPWYAPTDDPVDVARAADIHARLIEPYWHLRSLSGAARLALNLLTELRDKHVIAELTVTSTLDGRRLYNACCSAIGTAVGDGAPTVGDLLRVVKRAGRREVISDDLCVVVCDMCSRTSHA